MDMSVTNMDERTDLFDKSHYKVPTPEILPLVKEFFKQPTGKRDIITNIDKIRRSLSDIKPFSRLRKSLQNKILQEAWYECYSEQRTIVRQGAPPACFYVILSGTAILTYRRSNEHYIHTLDVLRRGCTFGEKGIMTNSQQKFTVTSNTRVELLVLWKEDFKAIYMGTDRHCSKDDLKFLKTNVPFLRGFAIDALNEFPHAIQHCSFEQSEVIAEDSRRMRHIYIVKSGSLDVWKRLDPDGYVPKLTKYDYDQIKNEKMIDDSDDHTTEATADNNAIFTEVQVSGDPDELNANNNENDINLNILRRMKTGDGRGTLSPAVKAAIIANFEKKFPGISDKREKLQLIDYDELAMSKASTEIKTPEIDLDIDFSDPDAITAETNANPSIKRPQSLINRQPALVFPKTRIYIHIRTLTEGQHFGLNDMVFPNQAALTLVSNKCECLLLLKSSFVRIATDQYKQNIRRSEVPYPSDSDFYKTYHRNEVWKGYSTAVYKDACYRISQRHQTIIKRPRDSDKNQKSKTFTSY